MRLLRPWPSESALVFAGAVRVPWAARVPVALQAGGLFVVVWCWWGDGRVKCPLAIRQPRYSQLSRKGWRNPRAGTIRLAAKQTRTARVAEDKACLVRLEVCVGWVVALQRH